MSEPDICANCGKVYEKHQPDTHCSIGSKPKWFPQQLAEAPIRHKRRFGKPQLEGEKGRHK